MTSAKLKAAPVAGAMEDYRAWGQKAEELLLEIYEICKKNNDTKLAGRISQFLETGELPILQ